MKIAICVNKLTGGGAERVASLWANGFVKQGHEVSMIISNRFAPQTYYIDSRVSIYCIGARVKSRIIRYIYRKGLNVFYLHHVLREISPDVVITVLNSWVPLVIKAKRKLSFKLIATDHNAYERPESDPIPKYKHFLKFEYNKNADAVTVLTRVDKDIITNRFPHVFVLPNPLAFTPIINKLSNREKVILAVGRLDVWKTKGFDVLLNAWGKLAHEFPDWKVQIMGNGKLENVTILRTIIHDFSIGKQVEFIPFQDNPLPYYQRAEIFCLSSRYEGFGMVLIEAMSQGCACIACDYKGRQREIITRVEDGLLCESDDVDALANALRFMITHEMYRKQVQYNAPSRAKEFALDRIMELWNEIFDEVITK